MRDEDVEYEEGYEERVLETRVHARTLGGDRSEEQKRPNLKIISGSAKINRANIVRVYEKERKREERTRKKEKETGHKRSELRFALPCLASPKT